MYNGMHSKINDKSVVFVILLGLKGCEPTKHFENTLLVITRLPRLILYPQVVIWQKYDTT